MNRLLEFFERHIAARRAGAPQRPMSALEERRRSRFFKKAPELLSLENEYKLAVDYEKQSRVSPAGSWDYGIAPTLQQFKNLPAEALTPEALKLGASLTREVAQRIGVRYTSDYPKLVQRMYASDKCSIEHINGHFISDLMAAEYVLSEPLTEDNEPKPVGWLFGLKSFTPGALFMHAVILLEHSVPPFSGWRLESLKDEVMKAIIQAQPSRAPHLCRPWLNRESLLETMISGGFFPPGINGNTTLSVRIHNKMPLQELLTSHMKCLSQEHYEMTCLRGLIKRHPIEAAVAAAQTPQLKRTLVDLYPRDVLLPHVKMDNLIKGMMIEDELGL